MFKAQENCFFSIEFPSDVGSAYSCIFTHVDEDDVYLYVNIYGFFTPVGWEAPHDTTEPSPEIVTNSPIVSPSTPSIISPPFCAHLFT